MSPPRLESSCLERLSRWYTHPQVVVPANFVRKDRCSAVERALGKDASLAGVRIFKWWYQQLWYAKLALWPPREPSLGVATSLVYALTSRGN